MSNIFLSIGKKIFLVIKSLRKIYRYGGYSSINIANISYGEILKGKRILITGGSSGIGLSIAKKCLQEGANIVITGRDIRKLTSVSEQINNPLLKILVWDIGQISKIEEQVKNAESLLGGDIDILVNNAGIFNEVTFPNVTEEIWENIYMTNIKGLFFLTQSLCKEWMSKDKIQIKKIINISSQGAFVGAISPYRMTKWDIAGLTQGLGCKYASYGIIVNGIAPGIIATNMQRGCLEQDKNTFCSENPLERFALPEEIAELAAFLMSDASNFIVGQTIVCDGGYSLKL